MDWAAESKIRQNKTPSSPGLWSLVFGLRRMCCYFSYVHGENNNRTITIHPLRSRWEEQSQQISYVHDEKNKRTITIHPLRSRWKEKSQHISYVHDEKNKGEEQSQPISYVHDEKNKRTITIHPLRSRWEDQSQHISFVRIGGQSLSGIVIANCVCLDITTRCCNLLVIYHHFTTSNCNLLVNLNHPISIKSNFISKR